MTLDVHRLRRGLRRYGVAGSAARAAGFARAYVRSDVAHVWYELPLHEPHPRQELDPAFELVRAGAEHVPLLDELWALSPGEAERRLANEGTLWLVLEQGRPAFSCWTFRGRTPIGAAAGGWLELPADTLCLEESMTSPHYRGRGVAPAAWTAIVDRLDGEPERRLVTTIEEGNAASRRAVEKIGFRLFARTTSVRRGPRRQVRVEPLADPAAAGFLAGLE